MPGAVTALICSPGILAWGFHCPRQGCLGYDYDYDWRCEYLVGDQPGVFIAPGKDAWATTTTTIGGVSISLETSYNTVKHPYYCSYRLTRMVYMLLSIIFRPFVQFEMKRTAA
ncbi:MAG: hypothetical protein PHQ40_22080 [Anaerolineaceae bacterium]|nr:hypothetical protein [Anaerolineaceae bacterium]